MLPAITPPRPRVLLPVAGALLAGIAVLLSPVVTRMSRLRDIDDYSHPSRYFSALAMLHRATCDASPDLQSFQVGVALRDEWGNRYVWECNPGGFTLSSPGADGIWGTADDQRSDR
ncbi:MAG TPA: hypothetical protein VLT45_28575 [Kofleriaceae bacterium]|nr:hypothetical protein [Kofleriaceae bacterium]